MGVDGRFLPGPHKTSAWRVRRLAQVRALATDYKADTAGLGHGRAAEAHHGVYLVPSNCFSGELVVPAGLGLGLNVSLKLGHCSE